MPVILLDFDGRDNSSAAAGQVGQQLDRLGQQLSTLNASGGRADQALQRLVGTQNQAAQASLRNQQAINSANIAVTNYQRSVATASSAWDRYDAILRSSASSTQSEAQRAAALASALESVVATGNQVDSAFSRMVASQDRAANSAATLASRISSVQTAQERLNAVPIKEPTRTVPSSRSVSEPTPSSAKESGSMGARIGGALGNAVIYGTVYGGLYKGEQAFSNSVQRDAAVSRLQGTTQAFTAATPQQTAEVSRYVRQLAGSGTLPFNQQQLLQGYYGLASANIRGGPKVTEQINTLSARLSAASGAQDTSGTNAALLSLIGAYGGPQQPNLAKRSSVFADQLTAAVIRGQYEFSDFANIIPMAKASVGKMAGVSSADLLSYLAAESNVGISPEQSSKNLGSLLGQLVTPNAVQRNVAKAAGIDMSPGFLNRAGGLGNWLQGLQTLTASGTEAQRITFLSKLLDNRAASTGLAAVLGNPANQGLFSAVVNSQGTAQKAIADYSQTPGAKLANSEAQLSTAFDTMTTAALPALTTAAQAAAGALNGVASVLSGPGGKGGLGGSVAGALSTLGFFLNPKSPDFGNLDKARADAGKQMQSTAQAQADARKGLTAPLTKDGMSIVGAAPGSPLYNQFGGHPYSAQEYARYGNAAQKAAYGTTPDRTTLEQRTSMARFQPGLYARWAQSQAAQDTMLWLSGMTGGMGTRTTPTQTARTTAQMNAESSATMTGGTPTAPTQMTAAQAAAAFQAGLAAAEGTGTNRAVSRIPRQLPTAQPGPGALTAGNESTAVRFAGQQDPLILENRQLRHDLDLANGKIVALLAEIRDLFRSAGAGDVARPNSLRIHGARGAARP